MSSVEQEKPEDTRGKWVTFKTFLVAFLKSCLKLAVAILMAVVFIEAGETAWNLIKDANLISWEETSTIIQMDLLQFFGFMLAWSLALITVSTWVTSWIVRMYGVNLEVKYEIGMLKEIANRESKDRERIRNEFNEIENSMISLKENIEPTNNALINAIEENKHLKEVNRKLRMRMTEESKDFLY